MQIMMLRASQLRSLDLEMYLTLPCDCHGAGYIVAATIQANGIKRYQLMCCACGHACGGAIAPAKLPQHIRDTAPLIANNIDAKNRAPAAGAMPKVSSCIIGLPSLDSATSINGQRPCSASIATMSGTAK